MYQVNKQGQVLFYWTCCIAPILMVIELFQVKVSSNLIKINEIINKKAYDQNREDQEHPLFSFYLLELVTLLVFHFVVN